MGVSTHSGRGAAEQLAVRDSAQQFWIWVTRPEYYWDENGEDREALSPGIQDPGGWWTCHRDTKKGDLVLLWRTSPKKDIGYLIQARSDAYSLADDTYAAKHRWDFGCDYLPIFKFNNPVTIDDLRRDPRTQSLNALRAQFRSRSYRVSAENWRTLNELLARKDSSYQGDLPSIEQAGVDHRIEREAELEDVLAQNLGLLKRFGYDLEIWVDPRTGKSGRQYVCRSLGGRIDLLCYDRRGKQYVVIELKNVPAGRNTFGQISSYVGWARTALPPTSSFLGFSQETRVVGLVISRGRDSMFTSANATNHDIRQLDIQELGFS